MVQSGENQQQHGGHVEKRLDVNSWLYHNYTLNNTTGGDERKVYWGENCHLQLGGVAPYCTLSNLILCFFGIWETLRDSMLLGPHGGF